MSEIIPSQKYSPNSEIEPAPESDPKRSNAWIYLAIIGLLLGVNIYLYLSREEPSTEQISQKVKEEVKEIDSVRLQLQAEYHASLVRLDELTGKNAQLDQQLKNASAELQKAKTRIQEILDSAEATPSEIAEARILIRNLNTKINSYEKQITQLKRRNRQVVQQRDSVMLTNTVLKEQVELGKVLHASNIRLSAIDLRKGGRKETTTTRAKRVDLLRIIFDIDKNLISDDGQKDLNIRIIDADQNLLSNIALGSGTFLRSDGKPINFSVSKSIDLKKGEPLENIEVDWQQSTQYPKGTYQVEVYHKGYLIGNGTAKLR